MPFDKEIMKELRAQGFKRTDLISGTAVYEKVYSDRKLDVQLWADGGHRVSHWHAGSCKDHFGVMDTTPTDFRTLEEMKAAIKREETRKDYKKVRPLKKGTMILGPGGLAIL